MKRIKLGNFCCLLLLVFLTVSCIGNWDPDDSNTFAGGGNWGGNGTSSGLMSFDILSSFTVETNTSILTENEVIPTDKDDELFNDYVENNFTEKNITSISFNSSGNASISGLVAGDTINVSEGNVVVRAHSKGLTLAISGSTSNGGLKIYSEKKFQLKLQSASITNPKGAAINIQNGNCFVVLEGKNSLSDGTDATYTTTDDEDMKAVFFSEDDLRFSGSGSLQVTAHNLVGKSGISSDDRVFVRPNTNIQVVAALSAGNGIKANDEIIIKGGVLNIETSSAGSKGLSSDAYMQIDGGRVTAITTGGVDTSNSSDLSGCAAIKCDSVLRINGGELHLKSTGQGGKGISGDEAMYFAGGDIFIITEGSQYGSSNQGGGPGGWGGTSSSNSNSVSPKGIRCDKDINISGGNIYIRTAGSNAEGIESKTTLNFTGGNTAALAYDDGFNAKAINISGGKALAVSSGQCDGMDSNGTITATGGVLIGIASTLGSEDGIDYESSLSISNATVIGLCSGGMNMGGGSISGHYISTTISGNEGDYVSLTKDSTPLVTFKLPRTYSSGKLTVSAPSLSSGTYSLKTGVTPSGGSLWMNYLEGCTGVSDGSSTSVTSK